MPALAGEVCMISTAEWGRAMGGKMGRFRGGRSHPSSDLGTLGSRADVMRAWERVQGWSHWTQWTAIYCGDNDFDETEWTGRVDDIT